MTNTVKLFEAKHIPCVAHLIHNSVLKGLDFLYDIIEKARKLVHKIKFNKKNLITYNKYCE